MIGGGGTMTRESALLGVPRTRSSRAHLPPSMPSWSDEAACTTFGHRGASRGSKRGRPPRRQSRRARRRNPSHRVRDGGRCRRLSSTLAGRATAPSADLPDRRGSSRGRPFPYITIVRSGEYVHDFDHPSVIRYTINSLLGLQAAARHDPSQLDPAEVSALTTTFLEHHSSGSTTQPISASARPAQRGRARNASGERAACAAGRGRAKHRRESVDDAGSELDALGCLRRRSGRLATGAAPPASSPSSSSTGSSIRAQACRATVSAVTAATSSRSAR